MVSGYDPKGPIFISYRRSDGHLYAELLDNYLRAGGLVPWRDLVDLPPGETAQRVTEAFEEGISNAILVVTEELGKSAFVPEYEVPPLLDLEHDTDTARPFHLLVLNTLPREEGSDEIDIAAPERLLSNAESWPPKCGCCGQAKATGFENLKQYAFLSGRKEVRQLYADLLDARLTARVDHLTDKEVTIQTQTRPEGNARSRLSGTDRSAYTMRNPDDPYDLIVRLRQDAGTTVPTELGLACLKETLPLMVDALYGHGVERVRLVGGGHGALLWVIGAALPTTRMAPGSFVVEDIYGFRWYDALPKGKGTAPTVDGGVCACPAPQLRRPDRTSEVQDERLFSASFNPPIETITGHEVPEDRVSRAAVLLQFNDRANLKAFEKMAKQIPDCGTPIVVTIKSDSDEQHEIPAAEGARLAKKIMDKLRKLVNATGIDEIHIASSLPVAMSGLLGRRSNTLNLVLYEWGSRGAAGNREYIPVVRIQPGMSGGPITEVFPQHPRKADPQEFTELVNLTPHPVNLMRDGECIQSWPAPENDAWSRVKEQEEASGSVSHHGAEIPVYQVAEGSVENQPPLVPGRGYIVPRITVAALPRGDFFFPHKQTRDERGIVNGFEALGQLNGGPESTAHLLDLLPDSLPVADSDEE